jgi:hypothetical protein
VCNAGDVHNLARVVDGVDNAVVANPDSPAIFIAMQLLATSRSGRRRQFPDFGDDAIYDFGGKVTELLPGRAKVTE